MTSFCVISTHTQNHIHDGNLTEQWYHYMLFLILLTFFIQMSGFVVIINNAGI